MAPFESSSRREFLAAALAVTAGAGASAQSTSPGGTIDDFFTRFSAEWMRQNPTAATSSRYFTGAERDRLARELTPMTIRHQRERIALARRGLADLRIFDRARMTALERISAELMEWELETRIDEEPFLDYSYPLEQMNGANVELVEFMTVSYPIVTERDAENFVAALGRVGMRLDEAADEARRLAAKSVVPPKFILEATIRQMQSFVDSAPAQNPFATAFAEKTAAAKIPDAKSALLKAEAEKIISTRIYPAWKRAIALLQSQTAGATGDAGLWRLKGGDDAYRYFLRRYTTTTLAPNEIHQIGLDQVASLEARMDALLQELGRRQGPVKDRIAQLGLDLRYPDPASQASRDEIMRDIDGILRDAERRSALLFDIRPESPVVARPFPAFRENNAAANYNAPPPDGSRPGVFQYPRRLDKMTKFGLRSTVYHETVPGHHFQIALEVENKQLPGFRRARTFGTISALTEGWGLYAERLALESGWYGDDIEGQLGALYSELFRARRLVVDTGLHAMKWTREQGIDYGIEPSEVERYAVFPGQACSYMIGQLKIIELRDNAKKTLGGKFALGEYHNQVLTTGTVPLQLLENQVRSWVQSKA